MSPKLRSEKTDRSLNASDWNETSAVKKLKFEIRKYISLLVWINLFFRLKK